ncbi:MAG: YhcH/YjgK/YiaL family protein [Victivallales bacterium]
MIVDKLENAKLYYSVNHNFKDAFEFLEKLDTKNLEAGRIEVDGKRLYAIIVDDNGKGVDGAKLETHKNYIDIQYQVAGNDFIGFESVQSLIGNGYDAEKDLEFYDGKASMLVNTTPGHFAIFFPTDVHAPMGGTGCQLKVVVKVRV